MSFLWVGLGGFFGAIARYGIVQWSRGIAPTYVPWSTMIVNMTGCFGAGLMLVILERQFPMQRELYLVAMIGFLGSYTTFSAFSLENLTLFRTGQLSVVFLNILGQPILGLVAAWLAYSLASSNLK